MNVEIATVAAQFLLWEYLFQIFGSGFLQCKHKVLTYVEHRAVSGVFQNIDPCTHPLSIHAASVPKAGGTHSPGGEGVGGQYFGRRT
jgi:hypothetical protein